jgi:outer membrane protein assembly factor BamB
MPSTQRSDADSDASERDTTAGRTTLGTTRRRLLAGTGSAAVASLAGCLGDSGGTEFTAGEDADADWPMPRFDAGNTAFAPDAAAPRAGATPRWKAEVGSANGPPVVSGGRVYLPTIKDLVALDTKEGSVVWRFAPVEGMGPTAANVHDGVVYVTGKSADTLFAVDAESGEELWRTPESVRISAAPHLVAGERVEEPVVFTGTERGEVLRLDAATGEITARIDLFGEISTFAVARRGLRLYVGTRGGEVYALLYPFDREEALTEGWRRKVGSQVRNILPDEEGILVTTFGGPLHCLQDGPHAGTTRWTLEASRANAAPLSAGYSFGVAGHRELAMVRDYDSQPRWSADGDFDACAPVAAGDTLYASNGESVRAFVLGGASGPLGDRSPAERWSFSTPAAAVEGLAVGDGALFVASQGSKDDETSLYCLEEP